MLDAALHNRLQPLATSAGHAPLVVLSDSLLQPSLAALRSFVHSALVSPSTSSAQGSVVLVCAEYQPHRLLPPRGSYDPQRVRVVDASLAAPFASTSTSTSTSASRLAPCASHTSVDLSAATGAADLVAAATSAIIAAAAAAQHANDDGPGLLVVLDSANALSDELNGGVSDTLRVVKACLGALKGRKGARLVLVHHDDLPPCPTSSSSASAALTPSLLASLLAPTLSPSTLHLSLRPSAHLETLAMHYALPLPVAPSPTSSTSASTPDPRAHGMLRALAARAVGDPLVRPSGAEEEDERVELGRPRCVVEWSARGVGALEPGAGQGLATAGADGKGKASAAVVAARERARERERVAKGEVPRVVKWGMCGAALGAGVGVGEEGATVREVGVWEVVDSAAGRAQPSPLPSPAPSAPSTAPPSSHPAAPPHHPATASPSPLTFSLSDTLTPSQLAARAAVPNPFAQANLPIYGQEGYVMPVLPGVQALREREGAGGGPSAGGIDYTPDRGDDWDEEDPDGDLEL
ncbi:hypothetical protein JCM9279_001222 [Rhodotorula babjevae]